VLAVIETHPVQYHAPVYRAVQARHGIPVTVIYGSDFSVAGAEDHEFGVDVKWDTDLLSGYEARFLGHAGAGGALDAATVSARGLSRALASVNPSAVLLPGYSPRFYRMATCVAWRHGRPILFRGETTDHAWPRNPLKRAVRDWVLSRLYRRCAGLLYIGTRSRQHLRRLVPEHPNVCFSPYCVDPTPFHADPQSRDAMRVAVRQLLGVASDRLVLLFVGKVTARKGPLLLVQAAKMLPEPLRRRLVILLVGSGDLQEQVTVEAAREPSLPLHAVGFQNQTALSRYYHAADLLVMPSVRNETWGLVVNEALHHGVPCVVSDAVGCGPDLIVPGVTGEVFEAGNVSELGAALARAAALVGDPGTVERCRRSIAAYSLDAAADGIAEAYRAAVGVESAAVA
jgi:glycosyltransferase involved in cell wall biosynthesis